MSGVRIPSATFEGMFIRALKVSGPVVEKLKAVGFDPTRMEPTYEVKVWRVALDVAAREYYPGKSATEAEFELGRRMVEGYLDTIVGKVIQAGMPYLSPDTLCLRLPRFFSSGIDGTVKPPESKKLGERHYQATLYGEQGVPWFTAGAIDTALRQLKVQPAVTVASVKPDHFVIDITWA